MRILLFHVFAACVIDLCIARSALSADRAPRLEDAYLHSNDLRVRIIYSTETLMTDETDLTKGIYTHEVTPAAELVEQARGSTDPLVLDLMVHRCGSSAVRGSCDAVTFARRWTEADTQNQLAWLTLASVLKTRGALDDARATFVRAAQASSWHEHYLDVARVLAGASPAVDTPRMRYAVLINALSRASVTGLPFGTLRVLGDYCKEDGEVRAACARIVATMIRDSDNLMSLTLAPPFARRAHVDPTIVATYLQESEAVHWSMQFLVANDRAGIDPDTADEETLRRHNVRLQAMIDLGERRLGAQTLLSQHISTSEAATRYVATMSPSQLDQRAKLLASD